MELKQPEFERNFLGHFQSRRFATTVVERTLDRSTKRKELVISGIKFKVVNQLKPEELELLIDVVSRFVSHNYTDTSYNDGSVSSILEFIGGGHCGRVYAFNDDLAIKFETGYYHAPRDGEVLDALQGMPFVPKLYLYNSEHQITLMQRIKGKDANYLNKNTWKKDMKQGDFLPVNFDIELLNKQLKGWGERSAVERGYLPSDLHGDNVMIDRDGKFWICDFGCFSPFKKTYEYEMFISGENPDLECQVQRGYRRIVKIFDSIKEQKDELKQEEKIRDQIKDYKESIPLLKSKGLKSYKRWYMI